MNETTTGYATVSWKSPWSASSWGARLLGAMLGWAVGVASAELLVYEGFDYEAPSELIGSGGNESGLIGSWSGDAAFGVEAESLFDPSFKLAVSGQRAFASAYGENRTITRSFQPIRTSRAYFSFLLRPEGELGAGAYGGWFGWGLPSGPGLLVGGATSNWFIETYGGGGNRNSGYPMSAGTSTLFVVRADLRPGNDEFRLYVNPVPGDSEPLVADATKVDIDVGTVNRFSLTGPGGFSFDEFRVGTSFADVLPVSNSACDLNGDQVCDVNDLDRLTQKILASELDVRTDYNQDGRLTASDRRWYLRNFLDANMGDSNLDGEFNSTDLVQVFQAGEYEDEVAMNSTWSEGDWDGDGDFTTSDLVAAFNEGHYESAAAGVAATSVPEPSTGLTAWLVAVAIVAKTRPRRV